MITNLVIALTAYCACTKCCGPVKRPTTSGRWPIEGITIAAPREIKFGTWIRIEGIGWRRADDLHPKNGWDVYFNSHSDALEFGRQELKVLEVR